MMYRKTLSRVGLLALVSVLILSFGGCAFVKDPVESGDTSTPEVSENADDFSLDEVKQAFSAYQKLADASSPYHMLQEMGITVDPDAGYDPETNYHTTDVDFATYKDKALTYVSEAYFDRTPLFSEYCRDANGKLAFLEGGKSGYDSQIVNVQPAGQPNVYLIDYTGAQPGAESEPDRISETVTVANQNGLCVIDDVRFNDNE